MDKRIPITLLVAILGQIGAFGWWASAISSRVDTIDRRTLQLESERDAELRASRDLARDIGEIKAQLKILLERMK